MRAVVFTAILLTLFSAQVAFAQPPKPVTNEDVIRLVKSGLGNDVILNVIQNQPGNYRVTPEDLVALKQHEVPDRIINAMMAKVPPPAPAMLAPPASAPPSKSAALPEGDIPLNPDVGVYYRNEGKWEELLPEVVNWKTGGVLKRMATAGIVKGDVNGRIPGKHSRSSVSCPLEIVIYASEGVAITEYQFLHLRESGDAREFRTVTGGVFHQSGGAMRDVLTFEGKKVASRMYRVSLDKLAAGEYGFLPPGAVTSSSSASIGKMYTFRLIE